MPILVKHNFISPVTDAGNPNELGPDEWNDAHAFTMSSGFILGRTSAGQGAVQELPVGDFATSAALTSLSNSVASLGALGQNLLINGEKNIDQVNNGASITIAAGTTGYPVDRWAVFNNTPGANVTAQRVSGFSGFSNALRITGSAGNTGASLYQRCEAASVSYLSSSSVVLSVSMQASANRTVTWQCRHANAADTWTASTQIATGTISVTTSPQRFDIPITLSAQSSNGVQIQFDFGALGAGAWVDVTGSSLIPGATAQAFSRRPFGLELSLAQRFLPVWNYRSGNDLVGFGYSISTTQSLIMVPFSVTPRVAPTNISVVNPTFFVLRNGSNAGNFATGFAINAMSSFSAGSIVVTTTAGAPTIAAGDGAYLFSGTAPSQIVFTGCELN
jgi:hypothetical protein